MPDLESAVAEATLDHNGDVLDVEAATEVLGDVTEESFLHHLGMTPVLCKAMVESAAAAGRITNIRGVWRGGPRGRMPVTLSLEPKGGDLFAVRVTASHAPTDDVRRDGNAWPADMVQAADLLQIGLLRCHQSHDVWQVDWMNQGASELLGVIRDGAENWLPLDGWMKQLSENARHGGRPIITVGFTRPDARQRHLELALAMVDSGGLPAAALMIRDVTDSWEAHARLEATVSGLADSNEKLQDVAATLAHDLRSPVVTVSKLLDLLLASMGGERTEKQDEVAGVLRKVVTRMDDMIRGLVAYAAAGNTRDLKDIADGNKALEDAQSGLRAQIDAINAQVIASDLPAVYGNRIRLAQLFQNLLENAIRYRGDDPLVIQVAATHEGGMARFMVRDNGRGFEPELAARIFDPYNRLDTDGAGLGMGLAICRRIVEAEGGEIWAKSRPGQGATFYFSLPAATRALTAI